MSVYLQIQLRKHFEAACMASNLKGVSEPPESELQLLLGLPAEQALPKASKFLKHHLNGLISPETTKQVEIAKDVFSGMFDDWRRSAFGRKSLGRLHEVESKLGFTLEATAAMDLPPYTELLGQQREFPIAFRHPEYMLSRDVEALYSIFHQSEALIEKIDWRVASERAGAASEWNISLARSTIVSCINLVESFVSGLAVGCLMRNPSHLATSHQKELEALETSLDKRILRVPAIVSDGRFELKKNDDLYIKFIDKKRRRNAFAHCSPGTNPDRHGIVKEFLLHDVDRIQVDETVLIVHRLITTIFQGVYGKSGPYWLYKLDITGTPPLVVHSGWQG
ncbi:hypothetical protein F183_A39130 [Bryobacterales bacterium F-183]|nr:hypothetical protein F183_A39130 [Bryobacterales bacterium F-183]